MSLSVEAIIQAAIARGELDDVPYKGQRIPLDDDSGVPEDERLAFRVLKNANMVPPEVASMNELVELRKERAHATDPAQKAALGRKIATQEAGLRLRMERNARR